MKPLLCISLMLLTLGVSAQTFRGIDKSPMDVAYLPDNYAHDRQPGQKAVMKVYYSRPQKKGRIVFGGLVPYGQVWRTGANEATEVYLYQDVKVGGKTLKAGTYSIFTIPEKDKWTVIFSHDLDYWGAFSYKEANDVLRVKASVKDNPEVVEAFSIRIDATSPGQAVMRLAWDKTIAELPITY